MRAGFPLVVSGSFFLLTVVAYDRHAVCVDRPGRVPVDLDVSARVDAAVEVPADVHASARVDVACHPAVDVDASARFNIAVRNYCDGQCSKDSLIRVIAAMEELDEQKFSLTQNYNQNQQKLDSLNSKLKYNQKNNPIAIAVIWLIIQGFVT